MKGDIEVAPEGDGDWVVQSHQGNTYRHFHDKDDAVTEARAIAKELGVELFIKNEDGTIAEKDSHGNDPPEIEG